MRTRLACILVTAILVVSAIQGCNGSGTTDYGGSDTWLQVLSLGDIPVKAGGTTNVPLSQINKIRFEVSKPVSTESLSKLLDFQVIISDLESYVEMVFTDDMLEANGHLVWIGDSRQIVEYRTNGPLSGIPAGTGFMKYCSPGDKFKVKISFAVLELDDGTEAQFVGDEFYIVWTESSQGPGGGDVITGFGTLFNSVFIGNVPIIPFGTVNVPLSSTNKIRFHLMKPISEASLSELLTFRIRIVNTDSRETYILDQSMLNENGEFVWIGTENDVIEYRMHHSMSYLVIGGQRYDLGEPGDRFRILVDEAHVKLEDGTQTYMKGDEFYVVWVSSLP
jgi:hypothetical protein